MFHFYLRHNNDIDNITPVIYRMNKEGHECKVFIYQRHAFAEHDYRLEFLRGLGISYYMVDNIATTLSSAVKAAVFDHVKQLHIGTPVRICKEKGIPTISLPHGMEVYSDSINTRKKVINLLYFDYVVTTDGLGSARYCDEWMKVHAGILGQPRIPQTSKVKVGWIQNLAEGYSNDHAVAYLLAHLPRDVPGCSFSWSPPLRIPAKTRPDGWFVTRAENGCSTHTAAQVIDWADVMLTTTSCTTADSLIRNKPTFHLSWLHRRKVSFADYNACPTINTYDELVEKLNGEIKNENDADAWINDYVYAGKGRDYDVLGAYVDYILERT